MKSPIADMKNACTSRYGGAITAALFLRQFVDTEKARPPARPPARSRLTAGSIATRGRARLRPTRARRCCEHPFCGGGSVLTRAAGSAILLSYEPLTPAIRQVWGTQTGDPVDAGSWEVISLVS